jgi:hypothetical protein
MQMPTIEGSLGSSSFLYGMDHQAIVWCHNLLAPLKELLQAMVELQVPLLLRDPKPFNGSSHLNDASALSDNDETLELGSDQATLLYNSVGLEGYDRLALSKLQKKFRVRGMWTSCSDM